MFAITRNETKKQKVEVLPGRGYNLYLKSDRERRLLISGKSNTFCTKFNIIRAMKYMNFHPKIPNMHMYCFLPPSAPNSQKLGLLLQH